MMSSIGWKHPVADGWKSDFVRRKVKEDKSEGIFKLSAILWLAFSVILLLV
jgi:hypothetical protein